MAASRRNGCRSRLAAPLVLLLVRTAWPAPMPAPAPAPASAPASVRAPTAASARSSLKAPTGLPISLVAQSSEIDYRNNDLVFRKVKISQGTMSVSADLAHANGLDFQNSHWVFRGNVKIIVNQGELSSDDADILFADKLLARASVSGNPARFSQVDPASHRQVEGHARQIDYDVRKGIIKLAKDAWLTDGQNEISGETLKYNIAARSVVAEAADQSAHRVHITITPPPAHKP